MNLLAIKRGTGISHNPLFTMVSIFLGVLTHMLDKSHRPTIRLQAVINAAARLVLRVKKFDHISTAIQNELQWLRIGERINFKLCILMHKCFNNCADSIRPLSDDPNRSRLRSSKSADVTIPRTKTKMGGRAFRVAGRAC